MTNWTLYRLGELTEWKSGGTPPKNDKKYWNGNIPWISAKNLTSTRIYTSDIFITQQGLEKGSRLANKDSLLLLVRGSGLFNGLPVGIVEKPVSYNQDVKAIEVKKELLDPWFLLYWIIGNKTLFDSKLEATGIGAGKFDLNILKGLKINLPPIQVQREIAEIAKCWDDKIELNRRMNQTLEQMAQTLFQQYFVNEIDKDDLPEGWLETEINKIIPVKDGTHDSPKQTETGFYLITSKHIKGSDIDFSSAYNISERDYLEINRRSKVDTFDILLTMIGTVGNIHLVLEEEINFAIKNIGLFKTSQREDLFEYLYLCLKSKEIQEYFEARKTGSTQQYLTLATLRNIPIILPPTDILFKFKTIVNPLIMKIRANDIEINKLITLRDTLLPKLMSGEIDVMQTKAEELYEPVLS